MKAPFSRTRPVLDGFAAAATPMSLFEVATVVVSFAVSSQPGRRFPLSGCGLARSR